MSYATPADVKSLFRKWMEPPTAQAITDAELQAWLDDTFAEINAVLYNIYTLPITLIANPLSYPIVKKIEYLMVGAIADEILHSYSEADKKPQWGAQAARMLENLVPQYDRKTCKQCPPYAKLPDTPFLGTTKQKAQIKISNTSGTTFKKGIDGW